jgi:WD40 repeat protein
VVVDQLEELFAPEVDEKIQEQFVVELGRLSIGVEGPSRTAVALALRADFYGQALAFPLFADALQNAQVVVGPMTADQLRSVIVEPAARAGIEVDEGLVEVMLRDVAPPVGYRRPVLRVGALPLLSHALLSTLEHSPGRRMTIAAYRASGGLQGAVAVTAERVYGGLSDPEQAAAQRLFLRLVRVSPDGADTARRVRRDELATTTNQAGSVVLAGVTEQFVAGRLLTADATTVQIAHESLLDAWPRLRMWVDTNRAGLVTGQRLLDAAQAWDRERRDTAELYRGSRLATAQDWVAASGAEQPPVVREFLAASAGRERRAALRLRQTVTALATLLVLAVGAGGFAAQQRSIAIGQEERATSERDQAVSRLVAGRAERVRDKDVAVAAQLGLAAYRISPTPEARAALIDSSATYTASRLLGSTGVMQSVALSPDQRILAAGTADRTVLLWSLAHDDSPTRLGTELTGPSDVVYSVAFSPDGRTLAAGSGDRHVHLWDVTDATRPRRLPSLVGPSALIYSVAFSPDGRTLTAGSGDRHVHLWDTTDPRQPKRLPPLSGANGSVQSVRFSPTGDLLAAAGADSFVRIWDVSDPTVPLRLGEPLPTGPLAVFSVAFNLDETMLAAGSQDGNVYLWDIASPERPQPIDPLTGASGWAQAVTFGSNGDTLATAAAGQAWIWDLGTRRVTARLPHPGPVTSLVFGARDRILVTGAADGTARLWRLPGPILHGDEVPVNFIDFSRDGQVLAVASGETRLWEVASRLPLGPPIDNPVGFSSSVAFTPEADNLFIGDRNGNLYSWDITNTARPIQLGDPTAAHSLLLEQLALSVDGTLLATGGDDNMVRLWNVADPAHPELLAEMDGFDAYVYAVKFSPNDGLLAAASVDNTVRIWDIRNPREPTNLGEPLISSDHYAMSLAFHPIEPILAVGSGDQNIYQWDITDPRHPIRIGPPLVGPDNYVYSLAYNPDGTLLAAANTDETLWLWDVGDPHRPVVHATLTAGQGSLYAVAFSPDGTILAAGGEGNAVWLWTMDLNSITSHICRTAGDRLTPEEWQKYVPGLDYRDLC